MNTKRFVLITTDSTKRGVFAGNLISQKGDIVILEQAQQCIFWSTSTHGVFGLASIGPQKGCRIGPKVPRLELSGVVSVADCTPEAQELWESEPWT